MQSDVTNRAPRTAAIPTCRVCARTFARTEHLRRHERTHTKEKPYICACGRSFSRRDLLTRHQRLSHAENFSNRPAATDRSNSSIHTPPSPPMPAISGDFLAQNDASRSPFDEDLLPGTMNPQAFQQDAAVDSNAGGSCVEAMHGLSEFLYTVGFDFDLDLEPLYPSGSSPSRNDEGAESPRPDMDTSPTTAQTSTGATHASADTMFSSINDECASTTEVHMDHNIASNDHYQQMKTFTQPWKVTEDQRVEFQDNLELFSSILEGFVMPSRITMSRYIAGYVEGFSHHHPFIHMPTFSITNYKEVPELVMAVMAIGAQYRYEHVGGLALYRASRAIIFHRRKLQERDRSSAATASSLHSTPRSPAFVRSGTLGALLLLAEFASWQRDELLVEEAIEYQHLLVKHARDCGLSETEADDGDDWHAWATKETSRRIKLGVFCFLNLQTLAFKTPPALMSYEIRLRLPTSCKEWISTSPREWRSSRNKALAPVEFQNAFVRLLRTSEGSNVRVTSPFGNYILIHALLQRLTIARQLLLEPTMDCSPMEDAPLFQVSLDRWKDAWQRAPESVLDLRNPKDSLSWSAMSLLGLAHIRTYFDMGRYHQLQCSEPAKIALDALECCSPGRGPHLTQALLHSAHILNIPVQLGVCYLSNCQAYLWSIQHCICYFECTIFLSKWLWSLSLCQPSDLHTTERQLVRWIWTIASEAQVSIQAAGGRHCLTSHAELQGELSRTALRYLAMGIVEIHAKMFSQCNSVWPLMAVVGESLDKYAGLLSDGVLGLGER